MKRKRTDPPPSVPKLTAPPSGPPLTDPPPPRSATADLARAVDRLAAAIEQKEGTTP